MSYNVVVCLKQIIDIDQMKINPATLEPVTKDLPYKIEDLSKNAIEAAVRIKEQYGGKVIGLTFGTSQATLAMKEALAMGVDEGVIIKGYPGNAPKYTASVLAAQLKTMTFDLIILGNTSADSYTGQIPGRLAAILDKPLLGNAISIELTDNTVKITRTVEDYNIIETASLPAIVSVEQEINEPRLPPLIQIMAAGRKPMKFEVPKVEGKPEIEVISNKAPKSERKRIIYEDIDEGLPAIVKAIRGEVR